MQTTDKDQNRIKEKVHYDDGTVIGVVNDIYNVNGEMYSEFKKIARLYGNNEGAALTACVLAWLQNPVNYSKIATMDEKKEAMSRQRLEESLKKAKAMHDD